MSSTDTCAWNDTICNQLGDDVVLARLSERDLAYPVGIDQVYLAGINVNYMASDLTNLLQNALDVGFRAFFLDLEWYSSQWNLGSPEFTVEQVCQVFEDYIQRTDTNLEVSLLRLGLRFRAPSNLTSSDMLAMNQSDFVSAISPIVSRVFTPANLTSLQNSGLVSNTGVLRANTGSLWPSLTQVLLSSKLRVIITTERELPGNASYAPLKNYAFDSKTNVSQVVPVQWPVESVVSNDLETLVDIPFRSVSISSLSVYNRDWGYSPVWNASIDNSTLASLAPLTQWTWASNEPVVETSEQRSHLLDSQNYSMCAGQGEKGLFVFNCYTSLPTLCQNKVNPLEWYLTEKEYTFFDAVSLACPANFTFNTPQTILEGVAAKRTLRNVSTGWIAANSLVVQNCWVKDIDTYCPYSITEGNRNGISQLVIVGAFAFWLFVAIVALEYRHQRLALRPAFKINKKKKRD